MAVEACFHVVWVTTVESPVIWPIALSVICLCFLIVSFEILFLVCLVFLLLSCFVILLMLCFLCYILPLRDTYIPYFVLIMISFPRCCSALLKTWFSCIWDTQDNLIDHCEHLKHCYGWWSQCNPSTLIRIYYITLDRATIQPSICHFLWNGYNRQKGGGGRKKKSVFTPN